MQEYLRAFLLFWKGKIFQKLTVRRICPGGTLPTKCQALLQCLGLLLLPRDMPVKVTRTTYCHVENDPCLVKGETDEWQLERYGAPDWTLDTWRMFTAAWLCVCVYLCVCVQVCALSTRSFLQRLRSSLNYGSEFLLSVRVKVIHLINKTILNFGKAKDANPSRNDPHS